MHTLGAMDGRRLLGVALAPLAALLGCGGGSGKVPAGSGIDLGSRYGDLVRLGPHGFVPSTAFPSEDYGRVASPSPIVQENALAGDPSWPISNEATDHEVEGYASEESAEAGDTVGFSVNAEPSGGSFVWTLYRLGWYGGALARKVASGGPLWAPAQPACPLDETTGLIECGWPPTFTLTVGSNWTSGAYVVKLHREDSGLERYVPLVVRDHRIADFVAVLPTNTWQAYNPWGGESLYQDAAGVSPSGMAMRASYDRPYAEGQGAEHLLWWQAPLIEYLERYGFDVTYGTNPDLSRFSGFLSGAAAFIGGGGHDEYWAQTERDQLDQSLAAGELSLDYFGANGGYWRVRLEPALHDGAPFRTVTCYKDLAAMDPLGATEPTTRYRDPPNPEPENALFGSMYLDWQLFGAPLRVADPSHWVFAGTGVSAGELFPGLVGYEFDGVFENGAQPQVDLLATSPVATAEGTPGVSNAVVRTLPGGQIVFSAGSIYFTQGLGPSNGSGDPRIYRMSWNVLERSAAWKRPVRPPPDFSAIAPPPAPTTIGQWGGAVTTIAGTGTPGTKDGPAAQAQFAGPAGVFEAASGLLVVADTLANSVRTVGTDAAHTVTTIAGNGLPGEIDGPGAQSEFRWPLSPVVSADGSVFVADSDNHVIRRIANDAAHTVSTIAGQLRTRSGGFADGPGAQAQFNRPAGLSIDAAGNLYVADMANCRVRRIANDGQWTVSTLAGSSIGDQDGPGAAAQFDYPTALVADSHGQVWVLDSFNGKVKLIAADAAHTVTTIAGGLPEDANLQGYADGSGDVAQFRPQNGLVIRPDGTLLVADSSNDRIRLVVPGAVPQTTRVYTYAGNGLEEPLDGPASQAEIANPMGIDLGLDGTLYVTDPFHGTIRAIAP